MKAITFEAYGGPEVLNYVSIPQPEPSKGEVLIKVKAASVNPVDWKIRKGKLKMITGNRFPKIPGVEMAGHIESLGEKVMGWKPGQKVFAGTGYKGGAYAEYVVVPAENLVALPENIPFNEACTLAVTGVTSLQALRDHGGLMAGMKVLVNGASGGIGTYSVQIAKLLGAIVTGVCSEKNIPLVKSLGADYVINYNQEDFTKSKNSWDIIIDAAGNKSLGELRSSLSKNGTLIKLNSSIKTLINQLFTSVFSSKKTKLVLLKNKKEDVKWIRDQIALGNLKVVIDREYPLEQAKSAHEYSETERARGKVILKIEASV